MRPHVKICGITRLEDADARARARRRVHRAQLLRRAARGRSTSIEAAQPAPPRRRSRARGRRVRQPRAGRSGAASRRASASTCCSSTATKGPRELEPHGARAIKVFRVAGALPHDGDRALRAAPGASCSTPRAPRGERQRRRCAPSVDDHRRFGGTGSPWSWDARGPAARRTDRSSSPAASAPTTSRDCWPASRPGAST